MAKRERNGLTEPMFYILMALFQDEKCEFEILDYIYNCSRGRVTVWPGTLYTLLDRFQKGGLVSRSAPEEGRGHIYSLTQRGRLAYEAELLRLHACLDDALLAGASLLESVELALEAV